MQISDTPLLVKTHDFNVWLLNHTRRFPKHFRHTLTERLERLALDFEQSLTLANAVRGKDRRRYLEQADGILQCLKVFLRYTQDFDLLSGSQVKYAAQSLLELGRLLGAWLRGTDR
jgi:hypothetical protein